MRRSLRTVFMFLVTVGALWASTSVEAQEWEQVLELPSAYTCNVMPDGSLVASDYRGDNTGGIWISHDQGKTWTKTDAPDHCYNNFIVAGDYVFGVGIGAIARSADNGKTWTEITFRDIFKGTASDVELDYSVCYGVAYYEGKLFVSDFVFGTVVYSEDFGETWTKTDNSAMAYDSGKGKPIYDNIYQMVTFGDNLYAFAMYCVYKYEPESNSWTVKRTDSNFMAVSTVYDGSLYCGRSLQNYTFDDPFLEVTSDGEAWNEVPRPTGLNDNNVRALHSDDSRIYVGLQNGGIYYTADKGEEWVNVTRNLPHTYLGATDRGIMDLLRIDTDEKYVYITLFNADFSDTNSGVWRMAKADMSTGINRIVTEQYKPTVEDDRIVAPEHEGQRVNVYDCGGRLVASHIIKGGKADVSTLVPGAYIFRLGNYSGKFVKK